MRDLLITIVVFGCLPFILRAPYIGVLVWSWLSYMNPHRLTWGAAYNMPFAQIVAITLFAGILFSKEKGKIPLNGTVFIWIVFLLWVSVTTLFALQPEDAAEYYIRIVKIQLLTFITMLFLTDQKKIDFLIWVIVLSIGFFSVKGGVFTIATGGGFRVYGPPDSFIEENNGLAVATLMIVPLMVYLYQISTKKWIRNGLLFAIIMSLASVVGSQSRGAFLAIIAVGIFYWLKTDTKILSGIAIVLLAAFGWIFMPESWHSRMDTIQHYEEDPSAMGRINAWTYSVNVANDRLTGAGLESWSFKTFAMYAPNPEDVHAAHSIYFSVLGDHGWPGLIMFLAILGFTWRSLSKVIRYTKGCNGSNQNILARMLQVSLIAYMSGGAFLSLSYFDLPWHLVAISILLANQQISVGDLGNGKTKN